MRVLNFYRLNASHPDPERREEVNLDFYFNTTYSLIQYKMLFFNCGTPHYEHTETLCFNCSTLLLNHFQQFDQKIKLHCNGFQRIYKNSFSQSVYLSDYGKVKFDSQCKHSREVKPRFVRNFLRKRNRQSSWKQRFCFSITHLPI